MAKNLDIADTNSLILYKYLLTISDFAAYSANMWKKNPEDALSFYELEQRSANAVFGPMQ